MKENLAVVDNLPEGGAKRVVFEQIKGLSRDFEIDYYTNKLKSSFDFEKYCQVKRFDLELKKYSEILRPLTEFGLIKLAREYKKVAQLINKSGAKAVIVHPCQITQAPWVLRFLKKPAIYFMEEVLRIFYEPKLFPVDNLGVLKKIYELLRRKLISIIDKTNTLGAKKLICTSSFVQKQIKKIYGKEALVLPLGVDTRVFKPQGKRGNKLLFVGQKEVINGYDLVKNLPRVEYVEFKNSQFRLTDKQMAKKYSQAKAVLCLGRREPFGLVTLEAMACNTPVIALNEGGYKETVKGHGILIKPDKQELINAINKSPKQIATRKYVRKHYSWENHILTLKNEI